MGCAIGSIVSTSCEYCCYRALNTTSSAHKAGEVPAPDVYVFNKQNGTKAKVLIDVGNKLNFELVFDDKAYSTSPKPVKTTGIGAVKSGKYEFSGFTSYASLQGGLDQATSCNAFVLSNTVTVSFSDAAGNPVGTFQGNSPQLPAGSKYSGDGVCNWVKS